MPFQLTSPNPKRQRRKTPATPIHTLPVLHRCHPFGSAPSDPSYSVMIVSIQANKVWRRSGWDPDNSHFDGFRLGQNADGVEQPDQS